LVYSLVSGQGAAVNPQIDASEAVASVGMT
jgi:hypothetical protein